LELPEQSCTALKEWRSETFFRFSYCLWNSLYFVFSPIDDSNNLFANTLLVSHRFKSHQKKIKARGILSHDVGIGRCGRHDVEIVAATSWVCR
jgi:hypothetical protein